MKLSALANADTAETPMPADLPQKLNCILGDFLWCHKHSLSSSGFMVLACSISIFPGALPWIL